MAISGAVAEQRSAARAPVAAEDRLSRLLRPIRSWLARRSTRPRRVRFEQAVYGSFPFWSKGYAILAHSPGCRKEWLADLKAACQRYGEPPQGVEAAGAMFALRLPSGPWVIVGVGSPGCDDRGRPGALSFHALFLTRREFAKTGYNPFLLDRSLQREWTKQTPALPAGTAICEPPCPGASHDEPSRWVAAALAEGRKVVCESAVPIDTLARTVWAQLPARARRKCSVATLAFSPHAGFHLLALPRFAGGVPPDGYLSQAMATEPSRPR